MKQFKAPKRSLGDFNAEAAATLITAAADVALIIDAKGVIRDVAFGSDELANELQGAAAWIGQPWAETVTVESRPKVEALLRDAAQEEPFRWRQLNHPAAAGADVPVLYSAVQVGKVGRIVAIGRDLGAVSALQQRLVAAQQSMERDYRRLQQAETRYRVLFQMASEAILIVEAQTQKIVEANPVADQLLGRSSKSIVGRTFPEGFDTPSARAVTTLLAGTRSSGRQGEARVRLAETRREFALSVALFRQENSALFLVRIAPLQADAAAAPRAEQGSLVGLVQNTPDGLVLTRADGTIMTTNRAFLDLAQLATEEQARGESLDRWLGRPGVDLSVLLANLRQHGTVRLFATTLRGEYGSSADVEISATAVVDGDEQCYGFTVRNVSPRVVTDKPSGRELPRSVEQLAGLVGRVSLKELVREATDVIERLCIEAALELTGDNRASAAEMLGLSRQSLYVKLRRYGLGDLAPEAQE